VVVDPADGASIQICNDEKAKKYNYMKNDVAADSKELSFTCLEGAQKLVAAMAAMGTAAYMLI